MAKVAPSYIDHTGKAHGSAKAATLADLSAVLGHAATNSGMHSALALLIFEMRGEIEKVFAEHDMMAADLAATA